MEPLLARLTQQAMNYAIRSGIAITTTYALKQSARLLASVDQGLPEREELRVLRDKLEGKVRILGPAIDLVELISARGNSSLETAVSLTKSIRWDVQTLGQEIAAAASKDGQPREGESIENGQARLRRIIADIKRLLTRIEDAVPLINLAITTSGVNLSTGLPPSISPSRLLQASTFVTAGDMQYATSNARLVQIGPTFTLSLYMLFAGHVRPNNEADMRQTTWKEVMHKARVKLVRVPLPMLYDLPEWVAQDQPGLGLNDGAHMTAQARSDEFGYQMLIIEDQDDGRFHTEDLPPVPYGDVERAGIREPLPVHEISKIFYADTGKILNIGDDMETNSPVLLLKRDVHAIPPRRMLERRDTEDRGDESVAESDANGADTQSEIDAQIRRESRANSLALEDQTDPEEPKDTEWRLTRDLDPEWLAFEVYVEDPESDSDSDAEEPGALSSPQKETKQPGSIDHQLNPAMSKLKLSTPSPASKQPIPFPNEGYDSPPTEPTNRISLQQSSTLYSTLPQIRTSLSLLETMLRLLSLQQFQQSSHLSIPDELLSFFLSEATSTTGAAHGDELERRHLRAEARRRVGFDPYDESPIKRRGEDYQRYRGGVSQDGDAEWRDAGGWRDQDEGVDGHFLGASWSRGNGSPRWLSPDVPGSGRSAGRRIVDEGYETQTAPTSPFGWETLERKDKASFLPESNGRKSVGARDSIRGMSSRKNQEANQSPSVRTRQRQIDSEGRAHKGSPLARVESPKTGP